MALEAENIEARPLWKPLHLQPVFAACQRRGGDVAERLFERGLCLPSGSNMSDDDLDRVIAVIQQTYRRSAFQVPVSAGNPMTKLRTSS